MAITQQQTLSWLAENDQIEHVRIGVCDINGLMRGKLIPVSQASKAFDGGLRMPLSGCSVDIWGNDISDSRLVYETGDQDGVLTWTGRKILPMPWMAQPTALLPVWFSHEDGAPFLADPRRALANVLAQYDELGLTPVVASELEFYLVDATQSRPCPPKSLLTGRASNANAVLSVDELDHFEAFFNDVYKTCRDNDIPADAAIAEGGAGQFEINLLHRPDALAAADDAVFFKRIIKGMARKSGLAASFMAKPYADRSGNGLHIHFSLLDKKGKNVFDDGSAQGSDVFGQAIAGLLAAMAESTLLFAPHLNSYRRLAPHSHAPTQICWGHENRHAALRIPGGSNAARRIEHRVAGADANPYLVLAAVLGAALWGIKNRLTPPEPVIGDTFPEDIAHLPTDWAEAIRKFSKGKILPDIFDPLLLDLIYKSKRQEKREFEAQMTDFELSTYLDTV